MNSKEIRTRTTEELETDVRIAFDQLEVPAKIQDKVFLTIQPLKEKSGAHQDFYKHSLRDALMGREAAKIMHYDEKAMVFGGCLHDAGKIYLPEILYETHPWTEKEKQLGRTHVLLGYYLVRDQFPFSAEIILWHHRFQRFSYPADMPFSSRPYSPGNDGSILNLSRELLATIDAYDALHRPHHDGAGNPVFHTDQTIEDKMMFLYEDRAMTIQYLYNTGIFVNANRIRIANIYTG